MEDKLINNYISLGNPRACFSKALETFRTRKAIFN